MQSKKDGLGERETVWLEAWLVVAGSSSCLKPDVPVSWADKCLEAFDARFSPLKRANDGRN